ncbi:Cysteine dioxygenase type 1 [Zancudomyces culisetae]|uniref:Cysteine dioxygenase n=1 Tax=Zancudomyces culisetae TaxID=1213189 RepID=A0A1R1PGD8_ZANCU|nr:Cysteine dioxygenase type 1 [Zancudomyces culisetae]|eukprot:OMH80041.1 Cysteine dioxygenase type 1 [Zancudomyces culisetae]
MLKTSSEIQNVFRPVLPSHPHYLQKVLDTKGVDIVPEVQVNSLDDLIAGIHSVLGSDSGLGEDLVKVEKVKALMTAYKASANDWKYFANYNGCKYTRNLVDAGNKKFNLLLLVWGKNVKSPIHDHANSHCMMKLLNGELTEEQFDMPHAGSANTDTEIMPKKVTKLYLNDVAYIHDKIGLHRINNDLEDVHSVSLHLYSPPYDVCKVFDDKSGSATTSRCDVFFDGKSQCNEENVSSGITD